MRICIFGASGTEIDKSYITATEQLGKTLAAKGHSLVFGGGKNGLMGAAARGFKSENGAIVGVAPEFFRNTGVLYDGCTEFVWTASMRDRKEYMEDNADAFIVTPGGIGTYEEFIEVLTLKQLARHTKPIALFNVNGYFNPLVALFEQNIKDGFVRPQTNDLFKLTADANELIYYIENDKINPEDIHYTY